MNQNQFPWKEGSCVTNIDDSGRSNVHYIGCMNIEISRSKVHIQSSILSIAKALKIGKVGRNASFTPIGVVAITVGPSNLTVTDALGATGNCVGGSGAIKVASSAGFVVIV